MSRKDILDNLTEYCAKDYVPMHMPGAKRNSDLFYMDNPYKLDLTEINGFDNMHHADGIIAEGFKQSAKLFGADETLFLINGSSGGILSAICGATKREDTVIVARNCHVSVYNALYMNALEPIYVYPEEYVSGICRGITAKQIQDAFLLADSNGKTVSAVIITSPTYEGLISEVEEIADYAHKKGAVLIVDEAHGAHFNFDDTFPKTANKCGADIVIQSIHKTLPAFTQTALLHLNGTLVNRERVKMYWSIYQTTSPSYLLMGSIDKCVTILEERRDELFGNYVSNLKALRNKLSKLKHIKLLEVDDISKIVLLVSDGCKFSDALRERFHIQLEMASAKYVIAMTSIGDKVEYYSRFYEALVELDEEFGVNESDLTTKESFLVCKTRQAATIYEAVNSEKVSVKLSDSVGRLAAGKVCFYPPGIPLINSGEEITKEVVDTIFYGIEKGLEVMGVNITQKLGLEKEVMILCLK